VARKKQARKAIKKPREPKIFPLVTARQRAFLAALVITGGDVKHAATAAKINRWSHYAWLREEGVAGDRYRDAFSLAKNEMAPAVLMDEAVHRATVGLRKYKFKSDGTPYIHPETGEPYYESQRSDVVLLALLNHAIPGFRPRNDEPPKTDPEQPPEQIEKEILEYLENTGDDNGDGSD
jgi:hypothetical protein